MQNCIIIGNGRSATKKEYGNIIDSFENVIRINKFRIKGYEKYIGTKTTHVVYSKEAYVHSLKNELELLKDFETLYKPTLETINKKGKEHNLSEEQIQEEKDTYQHNQCHWPENIKGVKKFLVFTKPTYELDEEYISNTEGFSTGFAMLNYLVKQQITPTVLGFDFYQKSSCYWLKETLFFTEQKLMEDRTLNYTDGHPYKQESIIFQKMVLSKQIKFLV